MKRAQLLIVILFLALGLGLGGCSLNKQKQTRITNPQKFNNPDFVVDVNDPETDTDEKVVASMKKFNSREEIKQFLEENRNSLSTQDGMGDSYFVRMGQGAVNLESMAANSLDASLGVKEKSGSNDFSETNVQVEGIDEADIVKTNGEGIFVSSANNVFLLKAYPASDSKVMSVIKLDNRATNLYLQDNYLIIFGSANNFYNTRRTNSLSFIPRSSYTFVKVFDISDLANPELVKDWKFEGNYSDSRLASGKLYMITNYHNYSTYSDIDNFFPQILEGDKELAVFCEDGVNCLRPNIYYFPQPYQNYNYTNIFTIDLNDDDLNMDMSSFLLNSASDIYMSHDNLYLTYSKYLNHNQIKEEVIRSLVFSYLSIEDKEKISAIEEVDGFILSKEEKDFKISQIINLHLASLNKEEQTLWEENIMSALRDKYKELKDKFEQTIIHKISLQGDSLIPVAQGEVSGRVLNQFSMDEYEGNFRIATTYSANNYPYYLRDSEEYDSLKSDNQLYILDKDLQEISSIKNLAPGERIYSARFMGSRAYLVTFEQIDPLFAIDLSNPKTPKVLGELKIPGFSNYLQAYDEDTLIGFGKDTYLDERGNVRVEGLKLSLFDVSDPKNLQELDTYIAGNSGSSSYVLNDHKALLFSKDKNLLVLPATIRKDGENYSDSFRGALVFSIVNKKFNLRSRISHQLDNLNNFNSQIKRSLYIDDNLYTFSDSLVRINSLDDLSEIKSVNLNTFLKDYEIISREDE